MGWLPPTKPLVKAEFRLLVTACGVGQEKGGLAKNPDKQPVAQLNSSSESKDAPSVHDHVECTEDGIHEGYSKMVTYIRNLLKGVCSIICLLIKCLFYKRKQSMVPIFIYKVALSTCSSLRIWQTPPC